MQNCMILYPNRADRPAGALPGATIDGGTGWLDALPVTNLQERETELVARSKTADPSDTQFRVTLGARREIRVVALVRHNLSTSASWRVTAWYDEDGEAGPAFQATADVYPSFAYTEDLDWDDENWWTGQQSAEELEGYAQNAIMVLPQAVTAPNWRIDIIDPDNPADYVQAARLFMAGGWQPSRNYTYGGSHSIETQTGVETALSGQEYFDRREPVRVARINFAYLQQDEALLKGLDLCRRAGVDGEVFWIAAPDAPRRLLQTSFVGRLRQLMPWEQTTFELAGIGFEIKETL